jgi:isopentenyl-diphosphate delta-isomerase
MAAAAGAGMPGLDTGARPLPYGLPLIASGGLRTGVEVAKALALGAGMTAMALPLVRAVEGGGEAALAYIERVATGLRASMLLTGSRRVADLRRGILRFDPGFLAEARELAESDARGSGV